MMKLVTLYLRWLAFGYIFWSIVILITWNGIAKADFETVCIIAGENVKCTGYPTEEERVIIERERKERFDESSRLVYDQLDREQEIMVKAAQIAILGKLQQLGADTTNINVSSGSSSYGGSLSVDNYNTLDNNTSSYSESIGSLTQNPNGGGGDDTVTINN